MGYTLDHTDNTSQGPDNTCDNTAAEQLPGVRVE